MNNKKIAKVVFYEDENTKKILTCLFFTDGTPKVVSYEEGLTYAMKIAAKTGIKTKDELKQLITNTEFPYIYAIPKQVLKENWSNFIENSKLQGANEETTQNNKEKQKRKFFSKINKYLNKKTKVFITTISKIQNIKSMQKANKFFGPVLKYSYKKVIAIITAIVLLVVGIANNNKSANTEKINSKKTKARTESNNNFNNNVDNIYTKSIDNYYNQKTSKAYNNYNFNKLLTTTTNQNQYNIMKRIENYLDYFNVTFAESYLETGKNIKAALSWEESIALSLAFNDYSRKQIQAMFNGHETDATDLNNAYKNAISQLIGAYIIENRTNPVNLYKMLEKPEEQAFVQKYEELILQCKEATGQDQINKINTFYNELFKDLPISDDIREIGIAHADPRKNITSYKLAITPIVAASEAMFQSLAINHTLSDKAIAYFNDIGLCNIADNKFEQAMYISITNDENENIPTYTQFRKAKIKKLKSENRYVTTDSNRDLSQLETFKNWVNPSSSINTANNGGVYYTTDTNQTTSTRTESSTSYYTETTTEETSNRAEAISKVGEEAVSKAEAEVDKQIEKENEKAKRKSILEAEKRAQKEQAKEDRKAKKKKEQVKNDNKDLQEKIDKENQKIENNKNLSGETNNNINQDDFGDHGVIFDDEHNNNGNLNNSVENITTDGTQADEQLPDSNQTGTEFDNQVTNNVVVDIPQQDTPVEEGVSSETDEQYTPAEETIVQDTYVDSTTNAAEDIVQQQEEYTSYKEDEQYSATSTEELINQYVENMANSEAPFDDGTYVYVK